MRRRDFMSGPATPGVRLGMISRGTILVSKKGLRVKVDEVTPSAYIVSIIDGVPILSANECLNTIGRYELRGVHLTQWEKEHV